MDVPGLVRDDPESSSPHLLDDRFLLHPCTFHGRPAVLKQPIDGEGFRGLRREAKFYRAEGSKLDGVVQKVLEVLEDENDEGEFVGIVLEALREEEGWRKLRAYSLLSREEAETLYSHLLALHTIGHYTHNPSGAEKVLYRPSPTASQPGSLCLFDFTFAESRHACPGSECSELRRARLSLGLEEEALTEEQEGEDEWGEHSLKAFRRIWERRREMREAYEREHGIAPRPPYCRQYDGPLDLPKIAPSQPEMREA
ncbi:hypothetical protein JCM10213_005891 [Rhodosporidiobolus nylandii]